MSLNPGRDTEGETEKEMERVWIQLFQSPINHVSIRAAVTILWFKKMWHWEPTSPQTPHITHIYCQTTRSVTFDVLVPLFFSYFALKTTCGVLFAKKLCLFFHFKSSFNVCVLNELQVTKFTMAYIHLALSWFHPNRRTSLSATYIKKWHVRDCYHLSPLLMTLGARKMVLWYGIWHRMNETSTVHNTLQNIFCWLSLSFIFLKFISLLVTVEKEVYKGSLCLLTETWPRTEDIFCIFEI